MFFEKKFFFSSLVICQDSHLRMGTGEASLGEWEIEDRGQASYADNLSRGWGWGWGVHQSPPPTLQKGRGGGGGRGCAPSVMYLNILIHLTIIFV